MLLTCGCRHGLVTKYAQESCCPTDIRQTHCWCWGEDALFDTPCGPDEAYHGHKPTCWRPWPSPASVWRDEHCGGPPCDNGQQVYLGAPLFTQPQVESIKSPAPSPAEPSSDESTTAPDTDLKLEELPDLPSEETAPLMPEMPEPPALPGEEADRPALEDDSSAHWSNPFKRVFSFNRSQREPAAEVSKVRRLPPTDGQSTYR